MIDKKITLPNSTIDLHLPKSKVYDKVAVLVHGGAWVAGSPSEMNDVADALCEKLGYACILPSYGLSDISRIAFAKVTMLCASVIILFTILLLFIQKASKKVVTISILLFFVFAIISSVLHSDDQVNTHMVIDVANAIKWTQENINASKITLIGHSAGGHLVALLTVTDYWLSKVGLDRSIIESSILIAAPLSKHTLPFASTWSNYIFKHDIEQSDFASDAIAWPLTAIDYCEPSKIPRILLMTSELEIPGIVKIER